MANPYVGTVAVTYTVTPSDKADTYPVVGAEHVKGGLRQVESTTALNAIFDEHKVEGMIVYVVEDGTFKMWKKDPNDNDTLKWMDADLGGGSSKGFIVYSTSQDMDTDKDNQAAGTLSYCVETNTLYVLKEELGVKTWEPYTPKNTLFKGMSADEFNTLKQGDVVPGTTVYVYNEGKTYRFDPKDAQASDGSALPSDQGEWKEVDKDIDLKYNIVDDIQTVKDTLEEGEMAYDKATGKLFVKGSGDAILDLNEKVDRPYKIVDDISQVQADTAEEGTLIYDKATDKLYVKGNDAFLEVQPEVVHPYLVIDNEAARPDPAEVGTLVFQKDVNQFFVKLATEWKAVHEDVTHPYYIVESEGKLADINSPEVGSLAYITGTDSFKVYKRNPDQVDTQAPDAYTWQEASMGGSGNFTNQTPTPEKVGGIEKGTTFDGMSIEEVLNMLLYPYQAPAFASFSLAGTRTFEIGEEFTPTTMSWSISNSTNAKLDTISATFNGNTITIDAGSKTATGNNVTMTGANAVKKDTPGNATATITAQNSKGQNFSKSVNVSWSYKIFTLINDTDTITPDKVVGGGKFASNFKGTHSFPTGGGYQFLVYPAAWGNVNPGNVKDGNTGLGFGVLTTHPELTLTRNGVQVQYKVLRSTAYLNTMTPMQIS